MQINSLQNLMILF